MLKPLNVKAGLPDPPFPDAFNVMNPTGSVVTVVWARMLAAEAKKSPVVRRRKCMAEGFIRSLRFGNSFKVGQLQNFGRKP
jgi:hypothetical protein